MWSEDCDVTMKHRVSDPKHQLQHSIKELLTRQEASPVVRPCYGSRDCSLFHDKLSPKPDLTYPCGLHDMR